MSKYLFILLLAFLLACKGKNSPEIKAVNEMAALYQSNPNDSTAQAYINAMSKYVETHGLEDSSSAQYILKSARVSAKQNQVSQALGFYKTYMTEYNKRPEQDDILTEVINVMEVQNKPELKQVLYKSFAERFPDDSRTTALLAKVERKNISVDSLLKEIGLSMFNDSIYRLDEQRAHLYVDACEAAVMANPGLTDAPEFLHRAAETARTLRDIPKAINLYDWIIRHYPNHPRSASSLFLKAFTYDNDLKDFESARVHYEDFLNKYPDNEFAESAQFLLDNLGKSEEELKQLLEQKSKENPN